MSVYLGTRLDLSDRIAAAGLSVQRQFAEDLAAAVVEKVWTPRGAEGLRAVR